MQLFWLQTYTNYKHLPILNCKLVASYNIHIFHAMARDVFWWNFHLLHQVVALLTWSSTFFVPGKWRILWASSGSLAPMRHRHGHAWSWQRPCFRVWSEAKEVMKVKHCFFYLFLSNCYSKHVYNTDAIDCHSSCGSPPYRSFRALGRCRFPSPLKAALLLCFFLACCLPASLTTRLSCCRSHVLFEEWQSTSIVTCH